MFQYMKVGTRLMLSFIAISMLGAIVAGIGIMNMANMNQRAERAYSHELLGVSASKEANINLIYIGRAVRSVLLATNPEETKRFTDLVTTSQGQMADNLAKARPLYTTEAGKALFAEADRAVGEYNAMLAELMKLAQVATPEGKLAATEYTFGPFAAKANYVDGKLTELGKQKEGGAAAAAAASGRDYDSSRNLMIALVVGSLALGIGLGIWITRGLMRQLGGEPGYAVQAASSVAAGDLASVIAVRPGDQSSLLHAMETMRAALVTVVGQVRNGTDTIATASNQIAVGNLDLSSRTEEQASSLEETASSMEELTSTVRQNADNAHQANTLAQSASEVAVRGGTVVAEVVSTMSSINESSRKIVDIIGVIDGIAFQTNILALNAAVEAARAGEQGRGFAVVASEVRNLAQRSAAAAKEIKILINDSVEKVDNGGKLVDQAGVTMTEIVQSITRVTDIMSEIASASVEQTMGIEQVNTAIAQMDEVTQQNAALVEEAAAAAASMQEQAASLSEVVSVFKLGNEQAGNAVRPARKAATPSSQPASRPPAPARPAVRAPAAGAAPKRVALPASSEQDWEEF